MDNIYLISLIVGGFFVLLSIFGGGESDSDADVDVDMDVDLDVDVDAEFDLDADHELDLGGVGTGPGLVDLFSIRALFLFAAFFGLTGTVLGWLGSGTAITAVLAVLTGLAVGLGGNFIIKRFAYESVSSEVSPKELKGRTAEVIIPFDGTEKGRILLTAKGQRVQLTARSLLAEDPDSFNPGDKVVVVRMDGRIAEVVKPD